MVYTGSLSIATVSSGFEHSSRFKAEEQVGPLLVWRVLHFCIFTESQPQEVDLASVEQLIGAGWIHSSRARYHVEHWPCIWDLIPQQSLGRLRFNEWWIERIRLFRVPILRFTSGTWARYWLDIFLPRILPLVCNHPFPDYINCFDFRLLRLLPEIPAFYGWLSHQGDVHWR